MDQIAIDLIGEFVVSHGNVYVLLVVDVASRFIWLRPLKEKTPEAVAQALLLIFADFGWPEALSSDNATEFANRVLQRVTEHFHIDQRLSTPYHPQGNGLAERHVMRASLLLKKWVDGDEPSWSEFLPACQCALNAQVSDVHGLTAFAAMFGRQLNPLRDYSGELRPEPSPQLVHDRVRELTSFIFPAVAEKAKVAAAKRRAHFEKKHQHLLTKDPFPTNSLVMIWNQSRRRKLEAKWEGPYRVLQRTKGGSYVLLDSTGDLLPKNTTPSQMKMVSNSMPFGDSVEVDSILNHRGPVGQRSYFVKWKGHDASENSWVPSNDFDDVAIIAQYWQRRNSQLPVRDQDKRLRRATVLALQPLEAQDLPPLPPAIASPLSGSDIHYKWPGEECWERGTVVHTYALPDEADAYCVLIRFASGLTRAVALHSELEAFQQQRPSQHGLRAGSWFAFKPSLL
jgi:transposase InsO family protein